MVPVQSLPSCISYNWYPTNLVLIFLCRQHRCNYGSVSQNPQGIATERPLGKYTVMLASRSRGKSPRALWLIPLIGQPRREHLHWLGPPPTQNSCIIRSFYTRSLPPDTHTNTQSIRDPAIGETYTHNTHKRHTITTHPHKKTRSQHTLRHILRTMLILVVKSIWYQHRPSRSWGPTLLIFLPPRTEQLASLHVC